MLILGGLSLDFCVYIFDIAKRLQFQMIVLWILGCLESLMWFGIVSVAIQGVPMV